MKVLVTGANGQLGQEIRRISKHSFNEYIFSSRSMLDEKYYKYHDIPKETIYLDVTDIELIRQVVKNNNIEVIVNCAAYTNVEKAENDIEACELLNVKAVENLAIVAKEFDCTLIHISTDYVFDGNTKCTPYTEIDECNPINVYGKSKLKGEQKIQEINCKHLILRTSWLYSKKGNNFVSKILELSKTKEEIKVVFDQVGTPTNALEFAVMIDLIILRYKPEYNGIYHYSDEGVCSWYDFASMIIQYTNNENAKIIPCHSNEFKSIVKRPCYSVLDKTKIKKTFNIPKLHWAESLKIMLDSH